MADGRITDYTNVEVSSGAIIDPAWANTETGNIETSINNGNDVMVDLEQNYASASAPTSAPNGKFWYDSSASADYAKLRAGGAWAIVAHDGMTTAFAFGDGLTVASNFAVSGAASFVSSVSIGANIEVSNAVVGGTINVSGAADFAGEVSVGTTLTATTLTDGTATLTGGNLSGATIDGGDAT